MTDRYIPVFVRTYGGESGKEAPPVVFEEVLRYAGIVKKNNAGGSMLADEEEMESIARECLSECSEKLTYKVCFSAYEIERVEDGKLDLGFAVTSSRSLAEHLENCEYVVVFGATIGLELDRLIAKYGRISPVKSLFLQAIGAERIESLCDMFNDEIRKAAAADGRDLVFRYSPGYGDLPLDMQKDIFAALDCQRKIGLTLNGSMLMSPSKSVTAIIGVTKRSNL